MDPDLQKRITTVAHYLLSAGQSVIPIADSHDTPEQQRKRPAIKWACYCDTPMTVEQWQFDGCNLGLVTGEVSGVVVVDCDSDQSVIGWLSSKPLTPLRVRTRRGMHFYYRHPGEYVKSASGLKDAAGFDYDIKGDRSYVLSPPSMRGGHQYQVVACTGNVIGRWITPDKLPTFDAAWRPETVRDTTWDDRNPEIRDGLAYVRQIYAKEGEGGDKATYRAAVRLVQSGLTESAALAALMEWNETNAEPPWRPRDLLRKVQAAITEVAK